MARKPKIKARLTKSSEASFYGDEPQVGEDLTNPLRLSKAYSTMSILYSRKESFVFLEEYLKKIKSPYSPRFKNLDEVGISATLCYIAKFKLLECHLNITTNRYFDRELKSLFEKYEKIEEKKTEDVFLSIKDPVHISAIAALEDIEDAVTNGENIDTKFPEYFRNNAYPQFVMKHIIQFYQKRLDELSSLNTDKELNQAYSNLSKEILKNLKKLYKDIIDGADLVLTNVKRTRKPRKKKIKSADDLTKNVELANHDKTSGFDSLPKTKLVGYQILILYQIERRQINVYIAKTDMKISIKGRTLENFDEKQSFSQTIRKPEQLRDLISGGVKKVLKNFSELSTKPSNNLTGRVSDKHMILAAY